MRMTVHKKEKHPVFPPFWEAHQTTLTIIVYTNTTLDIDKLWSTLSITPYVVVPKKRGRKKKEVVLDPNEGLPDGSIIGVKGRKGVRGVDFGNGNFKNSVTIVLLIDGKHINFKISEHGKFQFTGCKRQEHAKMCVKYIWENIVGTEGIYTYVPSSKGKFRATILTVMHNIVFSCGYDIDRELLDIAANSTDEYTSIYAPEMPYTGVNIKTRLDEYEHIDLPVVEYKKGWRESTIGFKDFFGGMPVKCRKKIIKERFISFMVFYSGAVIMSGLSMVLMEEYYNRFREFMVNNRSSIEETLDGGKEEFVTVAPQTVSDLFSSLKTISVDGGSSTLLP
jgi:TATA-box binding protein (TBP) (component of TFIID and TFIIIB)